MVFWLRSCVVSLLISVMSGASSLRRQYSKWILEQEDGVGPCSVLSMHRPGIAVLPGTVHLHLIRENHLSRGHLSYQAAWHCWEQMEPSLRAPDLRKGDRPASGCRLGGGGWPGHRVISGRQRVCLLSPVPFCLLAPALATEGAEDPRRGQSPGKPALPGRPWRCAGWGHGG